MPKPQNGKCKQGCSCDKKREYRGTWYWCCFSVAAAIDGHNDYVDGELSSGPVGGKFPINPSTLKMWTTEVDKKVGAHGWWEFP
jgi:hypothetical protein